MFQEPAAVRLEGRHHPQVAEPIQQQGRAPVLGVVDPGDERLQHHPVGVRPRRREHVRRQRVQRGEGILRPGPGRLPGAMGQRLQDVALPVLEHHHLPAALQRQAVLVAQLRAGDHPGDQRLGRGPLQHRLTQAARRRAGHPQQVEIAPGVPVVHEQFLGDQLLQHRVVALEGGEHVDVLADLGQQVLGQVAGPAAGLPHRLHGVDRPPGLGHLERGRPGLEFPLDAYVG
ncbi:hypothetical protein SDC9_123932 [bioreactor metagenome]|uniref:Uncharacterized protein n=1 Tax=bioreactor metagenome TaxID=1076179 RepID=A0A645CJ39_9ZZZZ